MLEPTELTVACPLLPFATSRTDSISAPFFSIPTSPLKNFHWILSSPDRWLDFMRRKGFSRLKLIGTSNYLPPLATTQNQLAAIMIPATHDRASQNKSAQSRKTKDSSPSPLKTSWRTAQQLLHHPTQRPPTTIPQSTRLSAMQHAVRMGTFLRLWALIGGFTSYACGASRHILSRSLIQSLLARICLRRYLD